MSKWFSSLSFRVQALAGGLVVTFVAALTIDLISIQLAERAIMDESQNKFQAIREAKSQELRKLFENLTKDAQAISQAKFTQDALVAYESIAYGTGVDLEADSKLHESKYYKGIELRYQEIFDEYIANYKFNNIAIALNNGAIVAQAKKDSLISKNIVNGAFKEFQIASCYEKAKSSKGRVFFDIHLAYDDTLKAYICSPILSKYDRDGYMKNDPMGVLISELDWNIVQEIADFEFGLGKTGELFFVAGDGQFRVVPRLKKGDLHQAFTFKSEVNSSKMYQLGEFDESWKQLNEDLSYMGEPVYSTVAPIEILGKKWFVVVQASQSEVTAPVSNMSKANMLVLAGLLIATFFVIWFSIRIFSRIFERRIQELLATSTDLSELARNLTGVSNSVNATSQEQAASLQETSASLDEISAMIQNTRDQAEVTESSARRCQEQSVQGQAQIEALTAAITLIKDKNMHFIEDFNQSNEKLKSITNLIGEIQRRTQVINDITFQTKLLSFNASVEAARAGEHGKGFSVVAEEIGQLAKMSSEAAAEIDHIIDDSVGTINTIVSETTGRVGSMASDILSSVEKSDSISIETAAIFGSLIDSLQLMHKNSAGILSATQEQSRGISEITKAANELNEKTQINSMAATKTSSFAQNLEVQIQVLGQVAEAFTQLINGSNGKQQHQYEQHIDSENVVPFPEDIEDSQEDLIKRQG